MKIEELDELDAFQRTLLFRKVAEVEWCADHDKMTIRVDKNITDKLLERMVPHFDGELFKADEDKIAARFRENGPFGASVEFAEILKTAEEKVYPKMKAYESSLWPMRYCFTLMVLQIASMFRCGNDLAKHLRFVLHAAIMLYERYTFDAVVSNPAHHPLTRMLAHFVLAKSEMRDNVPSELYDLNLEEKILQVAATKHGIELGSVLGDGKLFVKTPVKLQINMWKLPKDCELFVVHSALQSLGAHSISKHVKQIVSDLQLMRLANFVYYAGRYLYVDLLEKLEELDENICAIWILTA